MEEDSIISVADNWCQTNCQITKLIFEWKIQIPFQDTVPGWLNLQSTEFSAKKTSWRKWFLKLQGSIIELKVS